MVHQSIQTKLWKDNNDVDCLNWPSQSPDLNIIENIERLIKIRLELEQHTTHSRPQQVFGIPFQNVIDLFQDD